MNNALEPIVTITTAIIGVAILAVLVSNRANTSGVLTSFGNMFANMLSAATGPVTGAVSAPNVGSGTLGGLGNLQMPGLPTMGF